MDAMDLILIFHFPEIVHVWSIPTVINAFYNLRKIKRTKKWTLNKNQILYSLPFATYVPVEEIFFFSEKPSHNYNSRDFFNHSTYLCTKYRPLETTMKLFSSTLPVTYTSLEATANITWLGIIVAPGSMLMRCNLK